MRIAQCIAFLWHVRTCLQDPFESAFQSKLKAFTCRLTALLADDRDVQLVLDPRSKATGYRFPISFAAVSKICMAMSCTKIVLPPPIIELPDPT